MHNIFIKAHKDLVKQWMKLPFVATDDAIFTILDACPPGMVCPRYFQTREATTQKNKDDAKLRVTQLAEKR